MMYFLPAAFVPMNFVDNLKYMGLGMLGIFAVIGCIVLMTVLLNAVTAKETDNKQPKQ